MEWYHISDGEFLAKKNLTGLSWAVRGLLFLLIYSPLATLGYWIDCQLMDMNQGGLNWLFAIIITSLLLYGALFLLKGLIVGLRRRKSGWWIPLFIIGVAITCVMPATLLFNPINYLTRHTLPLTWLLDLAFAYYVYAQYNFLNQSLPFFRR